MYSYVQDFNNPHTINDNAIYSMYTDKHGNVWVGTYFGGVNVWLSNGKEFRYYGAGSAPNYLSGKAISQIIEDKSGNLWIGTEDAGLNYFDRGKQKFTHFKDGKGGLSYINIHALQFDHSNSLWIGSYTGGLNMWNKNEFRYFTKNSTDSTSLPSNTVYALFEDGFERLWVGTTNGLCVYQPQTNNFKKVKGTLGFSNVFDIIKDKDGYMWIGTHYNGLFVRKPTQKSFIQLNEFFEEDNIKLPTSINNVICAHDGSIWVGCENEGLYHINKTDWSITHFTTEHGLPDNTIYAIVEDDQQNLWLTTNNGVVCVIKETKSFRVYTTKDGLPTNQFNYKAAYKHSDGTIYLGSVDGMVAFKPENIRINNNLPDIKIVAFSLFGNHVLPNEIDNILTKPIYCTPEIKLSHNQSTFGFEFTAIDYTAPSANKFAFRLEGTETGWTEGSTFNKANYTNVPPGEWHME
jgi:ligand-binding sensor domain-containing protein